MHITPKIEKVMIKSLTVLNCCERWLQMVWFKKQCWTTIMVLGGTLLKSVSAVKFSGTAAFLKSVSFYRKLYGATNC